MSFIACLDLEGVLVPEIWIEFSRKTGIKELQATTRDISDYSELMKITEHCRCSQQDFLLVFACLSHNLFLTAAKENEFLQQET